MSKDKSRITRPKASWGSARAFIAQVMATDTDECIIWPYGRHSHGYGVISRVSGEAHGGYAHRLVCELAHGKPPGGKRHAAHSCGKGHEGCVNWKHLHWATAKQNAADKVAHGTQPVGEKVTGSKLTGAQVLEICALRKTLPAKAIAAMYGINFRYVYQLASTKRVKAVWTHIDRTENRKITP